MTDTKDQDATQLQRRARRRLVGAIALAVLAVIVLPIVFDKEPKPISQDLLIQIPNQDSAPKFDPKLTPPPPAPPAVDAKAAPAPAAKAPEPKQEPAPVPAAREAGKDASKDAPADAAKESPKAQVQDASKDAKTESTKDAAKSPAKDAGKDVTKDASKAKDTAKGGDAKRAHALLEGSGTWIVPMGSYTRADRVKNLQAKAKAAGFNSYTEQIKGPKGEDLIRLRAGPFPAREDADRAHDALKSAGLVAGTVAQR